MKKNIIENSFLCKNCKHKRKQSRKHALTTFKSTNGNPLYKAEKIIINAVMTPSDALSCLVNSLKSQHRCIPNSPHCPMGTDEI